jgi:anti-sigma factor RsiW
MTELACTHDNRDEAIVAYLYVDASDTSDGSVAERARFETHLETCARCRTEIASLRGVRKQLTHWSPPDFLSFSNPQSAIRNPQWWRQVPVWAQVAAALLFLGVSAGLANLDVRYDQTGLTVRTGWSPKVGGAGADVAQNAGPASAPWKADIAALESQLKTEIAAQRTSSSAPAATMVRTVSAASASDAEVTRRVRTLVEESEKRQQRELALRIAELLRDVNTQRQADLVKIDRTLGVVQNNVGIEVMKTRQQMNQMDLIYRASQRQ